MMLDWLPLIATYELQCTNKVEQNVCVSIRNAHDIIDHVS